MELYPVSPYYYFKKQIIVVQLVWQWKLFTEGAPSSWYLVISLMIIIVPIILGRHTDKLCSMDPVNSTTWKGKHFLCFKLFAFFNFVKYLNEWKLEIRILMREFWWEFATIKFTSILLSHKGWTLKICYKPIFGTNLIMILMLLFLFFNKKILEIYIICFLQHWMSCEIKIMKTSE